MRARLKRHLIASIRNHIVPELLDSGFLHYPLSDDDKKTEMKYREPFGSFRKKADSGLWIIEILFLAYGEPRFFIDVGIAPADGVTLSDGKHLDDDRVHTSALQASYRLSSCAILCKPFGYGLLSKYHPESADKHVLVAKKILSEAMDWFKHGRPGRHMFLLPNINY